MVTDDYSFNVTYLQDLGFALWTPGRTGPLLLLGRGRSALLGLFLNPISTNGDMIYHKTESLVKINTCTTRKKVIVEIYHLDLKVMYVNVLNFNG